MHLHTYIHTCMHACMHAYINTTHRPHGSTEAPRGVSPRRRLRASAAVDILIITTILVLLVLYIINVAIINTIMITIDIIIIIIIMIIVTPSREGRTPDLARKQQIQTHDRVPNMGSRISFQGSPHTP